MSLKKLLNFPELLLLISIIVLAVYVNNESFDFHLHDTYYVFASGTWYENPFLLILISILFQSWALHQILRVRRGFYSWGHWLQVLLSILLLTGMFIGVRNISFYSQLGIGYLAGDYSYFEKSIKLFEISLIAFILLQLVFWVIGLGLIFFRKRQ